MTLAQWLGLTPPLATSTTATYRSEDGTTDFRFHIVRLPSNRYRVHILDQPGYRGRRDDGHSTHRYFDSAIGYYICWDGRMDTMNDALWVAKQWAELTLRYIRYGIPF